MKKRNKITVLLVALFGLCPCLMAQNTMSDNDILRYVKDAVEAGKSQNTIGEELVLKGVSRSQLERVYKMYGDRSKKADDTEGIAPDDRTHAVGETGATLAFREVEVDESEPTRVYGRSIFRNRRMNFSPSENLATPRNYQLGAGDEVIVEIFGANQATLRSKISPEGSINVDILGPVYLSGMTVEEANDFLKKKLGGIYAGLGQDEKKTDIRLSLGQIRTIQINVLGDVVSPGTYVVSSFATVFHALYLAGGVRELGTLRNIKVNRNGALIATVDVYDFLLNGNRDGDVRLEEGDVIIVPTYDCMVTLTGMVKRPMKFEMKQGENLQQVLAYAGGFADGAYRDEVTVIRQNGKDYEVHTVNSGQFSQFVVCDGDAIEVGQLLSRFHNRLTIKGAVFREGVYQLSGKVNSVKSLIAQAGGLLPEAYTEHAVLHREREDRTLEVLSIDIQGIMDGTKDDVVLRNNDELYVPSIFDLNDQGVLTIRGAVAVPGTIPYADNMTLEDLIIQAGGLLESASTARVDVSRRIKDAESTTANNEIAQLFSFSLKDGFVIKGEPGFVLQPYDEVYVRKSPAYEAQRHVSVVGEVVFAGTYPITRRDERLTDLLSKIGGFTEQAYLKGARLVRQLNSSERSTLDKVIDSMIDEGTDAQTAANLKKYGNEYYVGIELEQAIAHPGSDYDIVLREGDRLEIPVYSGTVRVMGSVVSPNVVPFKEKKNYKYYLDEAGGYTDMARKGHAYIVHMNGQINQLKSSTKVTPGSEIIVPKRSRPKARLTEVLSSVTGMASLASTLMSLIYVLKK